MRRRVGSERAWKASRCMTVYIHTRAYIDRQGPVPMAGGALLSKIHKGFTELERIGLLKEPVRTKLYGAQAMGCNPGRRAS